MIDRIGRDSFFTISHWMVSELELDGTELLVYALIFNLSFFGKKQGFYGSQEVLRSWVGAKSRTTVIKALNELVKKNYIIKSDIYDNNGNKYCQYYAKKYNDESLYIENIQRETEIVITKYCQQKNLNIKNLKIELIYKNYIDVDTLEINKENENSFYGEYPDLYDILQNEIYIPLLETTSITEEPDIPVQNLYNTCTETVHYINNNKFNINSTSTLKELSPKESAAVEFKHLLQKLFNNNELPFSDNFYSELYDGLCKLNIQNTEYGVYLKWAYDECIKHNPRDIYDYFYKTTSKIYFIAKYKNRTPAESNEIEKKKIEDSVKTCPICSEKVKINAEECPKCNFPHMNFNNQKEIDNYKIIFRLPDTLKEKIKDELNNVYFDIHNISRYEKDKQEIYDKYRKIAG